MKKILLILMLSPLLSFSQIVFSENFDGSGSGFSSWTLNNVDALTPNTAVSFVNNAWVSTEEEFDNKIAMSTSWYTPAGTSNDWLISPQIVLPAGTKKLYWDARSYDATYKESYKVFISTTGNAPANFTTQLFVQGNGTTGSTGENNAWTRRSVDLSAYTGNIYIAFQNFSTDMFLLGIDNVTIMGNSTCEAPERSITTSNITQSTATINWTAVSGATGYDIAIGTPGFTPSTPTATNVSGTTYTFTSLSPNTRYQYYVRNACGSAWVGPYSLFTSNSLPYDYGFETTAANGGYEADGWIGAFTINNTAGAAYYADGVQMVFSNSSTTAATNRWLITRPIYLTAGEQVTLKFSTRSTSATVANTLLAKVGTEPTTTAQSTTLLSVNVIGTTFVENTATYTAPSAGTYYFSFNHNNGTTASATSLVLDKIRFTSVLKSDDFVLDKFSVYPNPVNNVLNITNTGLYEINSVSITDVNGRTIKNVTLGNVTETEVNVSELTSGVYFVNIATNNGSVTKKFIKN